MKNLVFFFSLLFVLFGLPVPDGLYAQHRYQLALQVSPREKILLKKYKFDNQTKDSVGAIRELEKLLSALHDDAFLAATIDTVVFSKNQLTAALSVGAPFYWLELSPGNLDPDLLRQAGFREKLFTGTALRHEEFLKFKKRLLAWSENRGYPFARLLLDSVQLHPGNRLSARLSYQKGTFIRFDTLTIEGKVAVKKEFLAAYLNLLPGRPFSQQSVNEAATLLQTLPYLQLSGAVRVTFENDRAYVTLPLQAVKASQFDGIVGVLPNVQGSKQKISITGQVNIRLQNLFSSGKMFHAEWQQLQRNSTLFNGEYEHPNLLRLRFDVSGRFHLYRQDTLFLNVAQRLKLAHHLGAGSKAWFFVQRQSSSVTAKNAVDSLSGAGYAYTRFTSYGIGGQWHRLDQLWGARQGWEIQAEAAAGNKKIRPGSADDTTLAAVPGRLLQVTGNFKIARFIPLGKSGTLMLRTVGGGLLSSHLFANELLRIGGFRTLRGFNENEFYASLYVVATAEMRLYFDRLSHLFVFVDQGWWNNPAGNRYRADAPLGAGAGISFSTKTGIFNFVYALGKSRFQAFSPSQSKVHFGLISRF